MSYGEAFTLVVFILTIVGACAAAWWRVELKADKVKDAAYFKIDRVEKDANKKIDAAHLRAEAAAGLASTARQELADHKLHVAQHYVSKEGHRESTEQVMRAIADVSGEIKGIRTRFDTFIDNEIERGHRGKTD